MESGFFSKVFLSPETELGSVLKSVDASTMTNAIDTDNKPTMAPICNMRLRFSKDGLRADTLAAGRATAAAEVAFLIDDFAMGLCAAGPALNFALDGWTGLSVSNAYMSSKSSNDRLAVSGMSSISGNLFLSAGLAGIRVGCTISAEGCQPSGAATLTMLPHLGQAKTWPTADAWLTLSRVAHDGQAILKSSTASECLVVIWYMDPTTF